MKIHFINIRNLTKKIDVLLLLVTLFACVNLLNFTSCSGCPYSFSGASVPPHLRTIAIPFAEDRSGTGEAELRELFTQKLTQKFIDDNNLQVIDRTNADAVLECIITAINDAPAVVTAGENVQTRRLTINVQVIYKDLVLKKTVFDKQFSNYGDYSADGGLEGRKQGLTIAVEKITDDILLDTVSGW